jgi:hypothetical protein
VQTKQGGQDETCRLAVGDRELLFFKNIIRNPLDTLNTIPLSINA